MKKLLQLMKEKIRKEKAVKAALWFAVLFLLGALVSRGIYGAVLPRVEVETPSYLNLTHQVKAEGKLVAGEEESVYGTQGLRIARILVDEGESVEAGQELLQYDLEDLQEIIEEKERSQKELQIQIDTLKYNQGLENEAKSKAQERAGEDYQYTEQKNSVEAGTAAEELNRARAELEAFPSKEKYVKTGKKKNKEASSSQLRKEWKQQKEALEQAVREKERLAEDTARANEEALLQARRSLEDAQKKSPKDSSPELLALQKQVVEEELALYRQIEGEGGTLRADCGGTVTRILAEESGRVPDGALLRIASRENGYDFCAQIGREERKYVAVGDEASLVIGADKTMVTGEILSLEEDASSERYSILIKLAPGVGNLGDLGTMTVNRANESRSLCVPLSALHQEEGAKFVLVYEERGTILGTEKVAVKRIVEITDSNAHFASLSDGNLSDSEPVIVNSSKPVEEGDVIRLPDK